MRTHKRCSSRKSQDEEALPESVAHTVKLRKIGKDGFKKSGKARKSAKKKHPGAEKASLTGTGDLEELHEEQIDGDIESEEAEEVAYREPTMYDSLLKKLGSRNVSVANALRRRQREEQGKTDTDEDVDSDLESISESEEKDDGDDGNDMNRGSYIVGNDTNRGVELSEDARTDDDDDDAMSDTDEEGVSRANDQPLSEASSIIRF